MASQRKKSSPEDADDEKRRNEVVVQHVDDGGGGDKGGDVGPVEDVDDWSIASSFLYSLSLITTVGMLVEQSIIVTA